MRKVLLIVSLTMLMTVSAPSNANTQTVTALGGTFIPLAVVAGQNDTITLQNKDLNLPHTLTLQPNFPLGGKFCRAPGSPTPIQCDTGNVNPGGSGSFTLVSAPKGGYSFFCKFHFWMQGTLVVS